jgi:hypothetical protein
MSQKVPAFAACILFLSILGQPALSQERSRPERIGGKPNLNGIWQAVNEAHWNLEGHSAQALAEFSATMGAIAAIPAGQSVVVGGEIPYLPAALAKRTENRADWPASDPEAKCYMPGIPRATYMPYPFQIVQGEGDQLLFSYTFANASRPVFMRDHQRAPVDLWMGRSNGAWDGDTLVIEVNSNIENTWLDRAGNHHSAAMVVTERYTLVDEHVMQYEATVEDPETFSRPWTIRMPLYRRAEPDARLLEFNCVKFSEPLLYGEFMSRDAAESTESP